jgi:hypothetical protein
LSKKIPIFCLKIWPKKFRKIGDLLAVQLLPQQSQLLRQRVVGRLQKKNHLDETMA